MLLDVDEHSRKAEKHSVIKRAKIVVLESEVGGVGLIILLLTRDK